MQAVMFNHKKMRAACETGFMNALAAATYLVQRGVPFREAHEVVAHAVQRCVKKKCELQDLSLEQLREFSPAFGSDVHEQLQLEAVIDCHNVQGGTAVGHVDQALQTAREKLAELAEAHVTHA